MQKFIIYFLLQTEKYKNSNISHRTYRFNSLHIYIKINCCGIFKIIIKECLSIHIFFFISQKSRMTEKEKARIIMYWFIPENGLHSQVCQSQRPRTPCGSTTWLAQGVQVQGPAFCFPSCITKELDWKQSSQNLKCLNMNSALTHCITALASFLFFNTVTLVLQ